MKKRSGGRFSYQNFCKRMLSKCKKWDRRYIVINSEGVMYSEGKISKY